MKKSIICIFLSFAFILAACDGENDSNISDEFIESRDFVFDTAIYPTSLTQGESFQLFSTIESFAPMPEEYLIENNEDLLSFNGTHTSDQAEYISLDDLDTYTYYFIREPGCPDYYDYSDYNYNSIQLTITLDRFHEPDVECPAISSELYITFKAIKSHGLIKVFKYDGSIQCEYGGISLIDMKQELTDAGVIVYCSQKGDDGLAYPAACGEATGSINIYKIDVLDLPIARELGFESVDELSFYVDQPCEEGSR